MVSPLFKAVLIYFMNLIFKVTNHSNFKRSTRQVGHKAHGCERGCKYWLSSKKELYQSVS